MNDDNKYKKLIKNTTIFAVGSFGSKLLTFLIVPLYTHILTTNDYGIVDLFSITVSLMLPFSTIVIYEAIIRYKLTGEINAEQSVRMSYLALLIGSVISILSIPIIYTIFGSSYIVFLYFVCLFFTSYNQIFSQYLRANEQITAYTVNGVIVTVATLVLNLLFLFVLRLGFYSFLYSMILSQILASIQVTISSKNYRYLINFYIDKNIFTNSLRYSILLIPNNLMWWIMNAGDKYIINYYLGTGMNGIYALSMKFPTILNLIFTIFMQAWQMSAISESYKEGANDFYDKVYKAVLLLLCLSASILIAIIKPVFELIIGSDFLVAWKYVPFLLIATILGCLATFFGVIYLVNKNSKGIFITTMYGAIINVIMNFLFIRKIGLYGVALGTAIGYIFMLYIRMRDANRELKFKFNVGFLLVNIMLLFVESVVVLNFNGLLGCLSAAIIILTMIGVNFKNIKALANIILKRM